MNRFSDLDYWKDEIPLHWHCLLDTFCHMCSVDMEYNKMPEVRLVEVREKLNTLRIYYNGGDQRTDAYAAFAWAMSDKLKGDECLN